MGIWNYTLYIQCACSEKTESERADNNITCHKEWHMTHRKRYNILETLLRIFVDEGHKFLMLSLCTLTRKVVLLHSELATVKL